MCCSFRGVRTSGYTDVQQLKFEGGASWLLTCVHVYVMCTTLIRKLQRGEA